MRRLFSTELWSSLASLLAIGFALRLASIFFLGSDPEGIELRRLAASITLDGIAAVYHRDTAFPALPLCGLALSWVYGLALRFGIPFTFVLRIPGVIAELGSMLLLAYLTSSSLKARPASLASWAYALSFVAIVASGAGDAFVPIGTVLCLSAVVLLESASVPLLCGAVLGLALNITPIAIIITPALILRAKGGRQRGQVVLGLLPWLLPLVIAYNAIGMDLPANIFGTDRENQTWGVAAVLVYLAQIFPGLSDISSEIVHAIGHAARILSITIALGLAWLYREETGEFSTIKLLTIIVSLCLIISPYLGAGSLVLCSALWCLHDPRIGLYLSTVAGLILLFTSRSAEGFMVTAASLGVWVSIFRWLIYRLCTGSIGITVTSSLKEVSVPKPDPQQL